MGILHPLIYNFWVTLSEEKEKAAHYTMYTRYLTEVSQHFFNQCQIFFWLFGQTAGNLGGEFIHVLQKSHDLFSTRMGSSKSYVPRPHLKGM